MTIEDTSIDNKAIVQAALNALLTTGDTAALERVLSEQFVHHRPGPSALNRSEWLAAVGRALEHLVGMQVEVLNLLADGDRVALHSRRWLPDGGPEITVVDIWRLEDGQIAEAWEIIEPTANAAADFQWWQAM